ncbi:hypothetical protein [Xanthomonas campestris]|uniref:hypothetical protein n=1 Tax=Xanthomonas campestris TaxID=339 RepID=UPI0011C07EF6|nr:hypothetical protein [Xanthomonas campestris]MEA9844156.1 hypothetical protein [Xanthomonas campestris pv. raphani]
MTTRANEIIATEVNAASVQALVWMCCAWMCCASMRRAFYVLRFEYFERCLNMPNHECAALLMCCTQMFWALNLLHLRACCDFRPVAGTRLGMAVFRRTLTPTPLPAGEGLYPFSRREKVARSAG